MYNQPNAMKNLLIVLLLTFAVLPSYAQTNSAKPSKMKLEVYYTHVTNRCPSCKAIEKETTETLNALFKDKMASGEVVLHVVNVDLKENLAIAEQFEAWGSSLFLVKKGDKKATVDLTREGFALARTKPMEFRNILAGNIERLLKN